MGTLFNMDIKSLMKEKASLIDEELKAVFPKDGTPNLEDAVWYHLDSGGKRVRPILAIATYEALGGKDDNILPFAAACEILHAWLLVHDDIEDGDEVRRDKPALWKKYGMPHGVNVGDYMAQKVYELILRSREKGVDEKTTFKLIEAMITAALKTAEGQTRDMNMREHEEPTEEEYMETVIGKTAHYLTVPMVGGAIVAGKDEFVDSIVKYGSFVGPVFQITDDVLDLTEGKGRGEIGRDIKEGKKSILVVHCLTKATEEEKKTLLDVLKKSPEDTTDEDVLKVKELFEKHGSIKYAEEKAAALTKEAKAVTSGMPAELKDVLDTFADFLVKRET
jgi:geranylgeranyl diphosphate synthase, type I